MYGNPQTVGSFNSFQELFQLGEHDSVGEDESQITTSTLSVNAKNIPSTSRQGARAPCWPLNFKHRAFRTVRKNLMRDRTFQTRPFWITWCWSDHSSSIHGQKGFKRVLARPENHDHGDHNKACLVDAARSVRVLRSGCSDPKGPSSLWPVGP